MQDRINGLQTGSGADSRFVSTFLTYVIRENSFHMLEKLSQRATTLDALQPNTWRSSISAYLPIQIKNWFAVAPSTATHILADKYVAKTVDYILRIEELLQRQVETTNISQQVLPIKPHKDQYQQILACQKQLQALKANFPQFFTVDARPSKSVLADVLEEGLRLVGARILLIGLKKPRMPSKAPNNVEPLSTLTILDELKRVCNDPVFAEQRPITKTTQKLLGIQLRSDTASENSLYNQFCPQRAIMQQAISNLRDVLAEDGPNVEAIDAAIQMEFPKPMAGLK
ncbi:hypothetical protein CC99x_010065 [Candidatus Berkiella cookevillensis]|uniref:Uncharacterized protein n=1 Tax=Candidatus Berkiella cookevillensis TaxID=437022 RepID=A0A0Q9YBY9_9GAMM|nr:hypothetical protein [Candidatus Berkiella cookevillensis]MCS5709250.1 hypothetical protein [Candidatus Berkiella cookevillensis]